MVDDARRAREEPVVRGETHAPDVQRERSFAEAAPARLDDRARPAGHVETFEERARQLLRVDDAGHAPEREDDRRLPVLEKALELGIGLVRDVLVVKEEARDAKVLRPVGLLVGQDTAHHDEARAARRCEVRKAADGLQAFGHAQAVDAAEQRPAARPLRQLPDRAVQESAQLSLGIARTKRRWGGRRVVGRLQHVPEEDAHERDPGLLVDDAARDRDGVGDEQVGLGDLGEERISKGRGRGDVDVLDRTHELRQRIPEGHELPHEVLEETPFVATRVHGHAREAV